MPPTLAFIPARFASSRFPGKPLIDLKGKPMVQRVWEQARKAKGVDAVYVATDDARIAAVVRSFGGEAIMTPRSCPSGTDRIAAALGKLGRVPDGAVVVNVQGDEPLLPPAMVEQVVSVLKKSKAPMATLARALGPQDYAKPDAVKVLWDAKGLALYFSRSAIPFHRDRPGVLPRAGGLRLGLHVGLYAYRCGFIKRLARTRPSALERAEKLEQLRVLDMGERIALGFTRLTSLAIDRPEDARALRRLL
ncbi:MAG TPA: 3-deoxy-manno-octulosonate cytidylyltransferase [bacterium]|jgi:3-deoxy-manno-octulosonate cytidylyltransferase (CMP-KDO synthetase)|nr:3-deoxy-manno-octulosonate cytidylyltransferase [bacterium]